MVRKHNSALIQLVFNRTGQAILAFCLSLFMASAAWAQAFPPAGQVNREATPSIPPREANPVQIAPITPPISATAVTAVSIKVMGFKFTGNESISSSDLLLLVKDDVNKSFDLAGLDAIADRVSRYYRVQGFTVARAYLPPQQSADGAITIAVIEGKISAVTLKNSSAISADRLQKTIARNLCDGNDSASCKGRVLRDADVERATLLLKDLPGTTAVTTLKPGAALGTSDFDVQVKTTKTNASSYGFDNYGSESTGIIRLNATADFYNPGGDGDQLSLGISTTGKHSNTGSVGYARPVGYAGTRMGLVLSRSHYRLGAGFDVTKTHGTSNALAAFVSHPWVRTVNRSVYLRGVLETRRAANSVDLLGSSSKTSGHALRTSLSGDNVDGFGGGGYTVYGLTYSAGAIGVADEASDASGPNSRGRFSKLAYSLARQQALSGPVTLYGNFYGQTANKNLDGSEQFGIGGPGAVRGYAGEAGGSTGAVAQMELRYTLPVTIGNSDSANLTYALFYDRGWVKIYQQPWAAVAGQANTRVLGGYGLSASLQSNGYHLRAIYAGHKASEPSQVTPNVSNQFWLQGGLNF